jgi:hypothetical protein
VKVSFRTQVRIGKIGSLLSLDEGMSCVLTVSSYRTLAEQEFRRFSLLWFLVGCAACNKTGTACDPSGSYRSIPLPSPKSLWEASSQSAWESECEASRMLQLSGLVTMGDLIDVQTARHTPSNARKLDLWNAGVDNLSSLLNLVVTMV